MARYCTFFPHCWLSAEAACLFQDAAAAAPTWRSVWQKQQAEAADIARQVLALAAELDLPDTARETLDEAENGLEQLRAQVEERAARQREADTARQELKEAEALARQADTALAQAQERCTGSIARGTDFWKNISCLQRCFRKPLTIFFRRVDAAHGIAGGCTNWSRQPDAQHTRSGGVP